MQTSPPPPYDASNAAAQKKGMGTGAKIGIGCGVVALLGIIALVVGAVLMAGKVKEFGEEAQKNPPRAAASLMVSMSGGQVKMVAEDDVNKRYTVKDAQGNLTTIYWDETTKKPVTITGDFSAIPATPVAPPSADEPAPEPTN